MTTVVQLTSEEVTDLARPAEYVEAVRAGYRDRGNGAPAEPRTLLTAPDGSGVLTTYVAILPDVGAMGGYVYTAGFESADAWFTLPLFDATSGEPLAIIDGAAMNPFKTGAAGAVAIDALAREDANVLGIIGSGSQAWGQLVTAATVRDLDRVLVYSPTPENRAAFAASFDERLTATVTTVDAAASLVPEVDILITATSADEPVFDGDLLEPGTHITTMGQYHPARREVDTTTIERSRYVPDLRERIHRDAGAFIQARAAGAVDDDHVHAELGEVVAGVKPGRTDPTDITLFDSGGTAIETVAAARLLYDRAMAAGLGTEVSWFPASEAFVGQ